ncbi:DNA/RNA helicase domain-containing protein [Bacteroides thetaiotaomicron]|uniref:DNA/RNA helicase domain-containing protein n=1 Tax=Bacteroides thetaiotaomicron TaxID=818 RepID=UPI00293E585D|nr:DNA/RNA helicase domain-containing protein [Bacteroides thetaiotaomicron]
MLNIRFVLCPIDWLEQVIYNEPVKSSFKEDEFDFKIFDDPQTLYDEIKRKDSIDGQSARLTAGFCWPWSSSLDENGDFVKDVAIGNFAMPWETKDTIANIPKGYVKWYEWAYKPEGIKQVGCIYTVQGFEFDYIGVIIGPDLRYDTEQQCLITDIKEIKDPMLKRNAAYFDNYARNIYRVLMSRGMKGCYVYCCDENLKEYLRAKIRDRK